jgi:hypothetical protein
MLHIYTEFLWIMVHCFWSSKWVLVPVLWGNLLTLPSGLEMINCPLQMED